MTQPQRWMPERGSDGTAQPESATGGEHPGEERGARSQERREEASGSIKASHSVYWTYCLSAPLSFIKDAQ